jgi:hypothetical protein
MNNLNANYERILEVLRKISKRTTFNLSKKETEDERFRAD